MRPESYSTKDLYNYLKKEKIATMTELRKVIGADADKTVYRKLKKISYMTSYSHRGKYYSLKDVACFDELGLWSHESVYFSEYGTLTDTVSFFISNSEAGYSANELDNLLHVKTKEPLLKLYKNNVVRRESLSDIYFYFSKNTSVYRRQIKSVKSRHKAASFISNGNETGGMQAAIILFYSTLNEKQRRHYAGSESVKLGYGGDRIISEFLGLDVHTVAKGRRELLSGNINADIIRKPGGGRKKTEKKFLK